MDGVSLDAWLLERNLGHSQHSQHTGNAELAILRDIVHALDHVHSHGLLHRDVKPANVFLFTHGAGAGAAHVDAQAGIRSTGFSQPHSYLPRAKLGDFGLSVWDVQVEETDDCRHDESGKVGVHVCGKEGAMVPRIASFRRATSSTSTKHTSDVGTVTYQVC